MSITLEDLRRRSLEARYYLEVTKHKARVLKNITKTCKSLMWRGIKHDISRYRRVELDSFFGNGADTKVHFEKNRHHPEYWDGTLREMGILDIIEMLCDWAAETEEGSIMDVVDTNQVHYKYNDGLARKIKRFFKEIQ